ncbi:MAG: XRE family transcriptional regulator, partial [Deltaproteobacteria bacterium]
MLGITIAEDTDRFVELSMRISDAVAEVLHRKGWTQKDLAARLGKTPAEVSKWLSGTHNLTL